MRTTAQKLGMNNQQFEFMIFGFYSRWCEGVAINTRHFQGLLANTAVNLWFLTELTKLETEFHELTDRYEGSASVTTDDYKRCYNDCTIRMFAIKPQALLDSVTKGTKGVPVFNYLNSN